MRFKNKIVWITGASSGIGEGLAYAFHEDGADIIISAPTAAELEPVKDKCTNGLGEVFISAFDMADAGAREEAVRKVFDEFGNIDILVNNAGLGQRASAKDTALELDRRLMEVNYFGAIDLTKKVLPKMVERKQGHLVVSSSVAGKYGVPWRASYCASKHALHGFFDTLRVELLPYNIDVTMVVPAGVTSRVFEFALATDGSELGEKAKGVGISPADCAEKILSALVKGKHEVNIGLRAPMALLWCKRFAPSLLFQYVKRMSLVNRFRPPELMRPSE